MKKIYRSEDNKIIGGVFGGLGERYDVDPTILRLLFLATTLLTAVGPGLVFYIGALLVIPKKPKTL